MYNLESSYLDLMNTILVTEKWKENRTGIRTKSGQGAMLRFNGDSFPLFTTKKINFNLVKAELLWFLSGSTNCADLDKIYPQGPNIWSENAKAWNDKMRKAAADAGGFWKAANTKCGEIYGATWRSYRDGDERIDQIANAVDQIKNDPLSRRIIVCGWSPAHHMNNDFYACLPPCHVLHRYSVDVEDNTLNMTMYQRSADLFIGVPFNIASYALLLRMMAHVTGRKPGQIIFFLDDVHIYENSYDQCIEQLKRKNQQFPFPKLVLNPEVKNIDHFGMDDISIEGYKSHPYIKAEMVV